jgi:hypothetical protein
MYTGAVGDSYTGSGYSAGEAGGYIVDRWV